MTQNFKLSGAFLDNRWIRIDYQGGEQGRIERGGGFLLFSDNASTLKGTFAGIGPFTEGAIYGTLELNKEGQNRMQSTRSRRKGQAVPKNLAENVKNDPEVQAN